MESGGERKQSRTRVATGRGEPGSAGTGPRAVKAPRAGQDRSGQILAKVVAKHGQAGHAAAMFIMTESDAAAICDAFHQEGELSAIIELR